jgi:hypothetical protein
VAKVKFAVPDEFFAVVMDGIRMGKLGGIGSINISKIINIFYFIKVI